MRYSIWHGLAWVAGALFVFLLYFYASRLPPRTPGPLSVYATRGPVSSKEFISQILYFIIFTVHSHLCTGISIPLDELMRGPLPQNDSRLIDYIWAHNFLRPPSTMPYNLENFKGDPSMGQSIIVKHALNDMVRCVTCFCILLYKYNRRYCFSLQKNGFFVECGALDGETRSNTLMLERDYGWKVISSC